ncbi:hypothetical protein PLESTM_000171100 [Pleodorina starrii]|nr:hypothetical protein PLESTM_000171100 [Pleodorina starrii]
MASTAPLTTNGPAAADDSEEQAKEPIQQAAPAPDPDMSKPHPKVFVFASPKKRQGKPPEPRQPISKQAIKAKLRKALAPYLTSSYLQGEMAKRFTKEYMAAHPPPQNEDELPAYLQDHMAELNRVTERWGGCVARALDPLTHEMAVEGRLQRLRAREEGLSVEPPPPGGLPFATRRQGDGPPDSDDEDVDWEGARPPDDRLTSAQVFGAVHLVSDVKVWQQILAAQRAEERRQHAIAELHMNHAAKIIQRSWHSFITRKKEEQARLDALVSPDVQAMLSAAAYKAMRDARNKLAVLKLRKSLSRKARGFGSTAPRDLEPIPRQAGPQSGPQPMSPARRGREGRSTAPGARRSLGVDGATSSEADGDGGGRSRSSSPSRPRNGAVAKLQSFAARSARIVTRLVSIKEPYDEEGTAAAEDGGVAGGAGGGRRQPAHRSRGARGRGGAPRRKRPSGAAGGDGAEAADGGGEGGGGEGGAAAGAAAAGSGEEDGSEWDEDEGDEDEGDDDEDDEFGLEEGDVDSHSGSGSDVEENEEESAEAAMAEAEEVVQVAAELAKAFMGPAGGGGGGDGDGDDSSHGSGSECDDDDVGDNDGEGVIEQMGDEALRVLTSVELAAAAATDGDGGKAAVMPLAPPPLRTAVAAAAAAAADGANGADAAAAAARRAAAAAAATVGPHRGQSLTLTEDAAVIRQLIAGALAAAASPVLGRKKALAMAQMGLGELLQLPGAKGLLPKAAAEAARRRPPRGHRNEPMAATGRAVAGGGGGGGGGGATAGHPREPSWLLPPINRSSTGPAVLGGGGGAAAPPAGGQSGPATAVASASGIARTGSDSTLQRPLVVVGGGVAAASAVGGGPGAMAAAAAAAAVGRARRSSVVGSSMDGSAAGLHSVEVGSPLVVQQSSFMISSLSPAGVTQVAQKVRLSSLTSGGDAAQQPVPLPQQQQYSQPPQQPVPLPSALAGGGGGAGGGTAAARQAAAVAQFAVQARIS